jgi:aconitate hydratase
MAPEYGASSGFFPVDEQTLAYLLATGRTPAQADLVAAYARRQALWFDPDASPRYTDTIEIDLAKIGVSLAGPRRPQDRLSPAQTVEALAGLWDVPLRPAPAAAAEPPDGAVAIAAITSCTNTSNPRLTVAAGLLARKARQLGLKPKPWVKTSFAPGSPTADRYLRRAGLLDDLEAVGFGIVGYGCTTCIGNSGALAPAMQRAVEERGVHPVAVLSGNRNFPGRVHAQIEAGFLASPPLTVAYALAGDVNRNILTDPVAHRPDGAAVHLKDLWPTGDEIDAALAAAADPGDFDDAYDEAEGSDVWRRLDVPATPLFPWDEASTYIRRPPFVSVETETRLGHYVAQPLIVLGDDMTTDHISPAGQIPARSDAADHLVARGEDRRDLNVFAARRGNWEVMLRGLFVNRNARNELCPTAPPGATLHVPSGEILPLWRAAERYADDGESVVLVAGERYGTGSSRDWAAKGPALLGIRAVLAVSFERIHRSNLVGMGILPVKLPADRHPTELLLAPGDRIEVDARPGTLTPRARVPVRIHRASGTIESFDAIAAVETTLEIAILQSGGVLPLILNRTLTSKAASRPADEERSSADRRPGAARPAR